MVTLTAYSPLVLQCWPSDTVMVWQTRHLIHSLEEGEAQYQLNDGKPHIRVVIWGRGVGPMTRRLQGDS